MSILICVFALLNGVFSIIRVNENFLNFYAHEDAFARYQITYGLESICFTGAMWFYSITYYQTARDIKRLMQYKSPPVSDVPQERTPIVESDDKFSSGNGLGSEKDPRRMIGKFHHQVFVFGVGQKDGTVMVY